MVTAADLDLFRDDVVLLNGGHFPAEIDVPGICADDRVTTVTHITDGIATARLHDGRRIHLLTAGHMVNLAGPRPLGNSIESMDIGFALQARCLEAVAAGRVGKESAVVPVPRLIDETVAEAYLAGA